MTPHLAWFKGGDLERSFCAYYGLPTWISAIACRRPYYNEQLRLPDASVLNGVMLTVLMFRAT